MASREELLYTSNLNGMVQSSFLGRPRRNSLSPARVRRPASASPRPQHQSSSSSSMAVKKTNSLTSSLINNEKKEKQPHYLSPTQSSKKKKNLSNGLDKRKEKTPAKKKDADEVSVISLSRLARSPGGRKDMDEELVKKNPSLTPILQRKRADIAQHLAAASHSAALSSAEGELEKAMKLRLKAVEYAARLYDETEVEFVQELYQLGLCYYDAGKYEEAKEVLMRCSELLESNDEHLQAEVLLCTGNVALAQKKGYEALKWYERSMELVSKVVNGQAYRKTKSSITDFSDQPEHYSVLLNSGLAYFQMGKLQEALKMYKRALRVCQSVMGSDGLATATACRNIGVVYHAELDYRNAVRMFKKALQLIEREYPGTHPDVVVLLKSIGQCYMSAHKFPSASKYFQRILRGLESTFGEFHTETAAIYHDLGVIESGLRNYEAAAEYLVKALNVREKQLGPNHSDTEETKQKLLKVKKRIERNAVLGESVSRSRSQPSAVKKERRRSVKIQEPDFSISGSLQKTIRERKREEFRFTESPPPSPISSETSSFSTQSMSSPSPVEAAPKLSPDVLQKFNELNATAASKPVTMPNASAAAPAVNRLRRQDSVRSTLTTTSVGSTGTWATWDGEDF